jgi:polar amino acid transport system substrate-binding protein
MKIYIIALILCAFTSNAMANVVQLVTGNDYQPYTDQALPNRGMITEIVELAFKEMGYQPKIVFRPWKRAYAETREGIFAGSFPYIKSEARLKNFYFSDPIHTMSIRIFVATNSPIREVEDIQGKRICIPLGYAVSKKFKEFLGDDIKKREANPSDLASCLRMIKSGRKDFFIINEINGWMMIQKTFHTKEYFRTLDNVFEEETHHLIVSKSYPGGEQLIVDFNKGLKKLKEKGLLAEIINRHLKAFSGAR